MFQTAKVNLILVFSKNLGNGETKTANVTLQNVRASLTAAEISQLATALGSLIKHTLVEVQVAEYKYVR